MYAVYKYFDNQVTIISIHDTFSEAFHKAMKMNNNHIFKERGIEFYAEEYEI